MQILWLMIRLRSKLQTKKQKGCGHLIDDEDDGTGV